MIKTNALLQRGLKKFWASKSGGVLIYIAFGLPILLGAMALSIDLGRAFILNTELKDFSDAAALAGAAELDGRDGAMAAAEAAARTGLSGTLLNVQAFATDGGGPNIAIKTGGDGIVFLRNLPADGTDFTLADTATGDADARFIFVSVVNRNVRSGLSRALGVIPDFDTDARSIAGFSSVTCRVPPIMMCNPLEADGKDGYALFPVTPDQIALGCDENVHLGPGVPLTEACLTGRQMLAKKSGKSSAYVPGNFGMLDPTVCGGKNVNQGAKCLGEQIATYAPDFCVIDTVDFNPGETMGPVRAAFNVRFDMYTAPHFNNADANPFYPPAMNVTKGYTPPGCNSNPEADAEIALDLPRDSCFAAATCADDRFGNGDWYFKTYDDDGLPATPMVEPYWAINHPGVSEPTVSNGPYYMNYADMNRYQIYRHEIENNMIPDNSLGNGENGNPSCYTGSTPIPDPSVDPDDIGINETDRRVLVMAAVNCRQWEIDNAPDKLAGNESDVPTIGFIRIFMTEPAIEPGGGGGGGDGAAQADLYVELAGVLDQAETDALRDIVQLYR